MIDGDTIDIAGQRIRIWGVDAFEAAQQCQRGNANTACGAQASQALSRLVEDQDVICVQRDIDRYGRIVAQCRVTEVDVGAYMVLAGHAVAFRRYALDYIHDEELARAAQVGAWRGSFTPPSDYRSTETNSIAAAQRTADPSNGACTIKGNINRRGERIYHLPSDPYYGRTNPEAMFCTEAEARAAGFRRAGQP